MTSKKIHITDGSPYPYTPQKDINDVSLASLMHSTSSVGGAGDMEHQDLDRLYTVKFQNDLVQVKNRTND
jgi:hypothetical protein